MTVAFMNLSKFMIGVIGGFGSCLQHRFGKVIFLFSRGFVTCLSGVTILPESED
jgi:hypothetical protein